MEDIAKGCRTVGPRCGCSDEKIIKDMTHLGNLELGLNWSKGKGGTARTKGKNHVEEIQALPFHRKQFPIRRVDRDVPEGGFARKFSSDSIKAHSCPNIQSLKC